MLLRVLKKTGSGLGGEGFIVQEDKEVNIMDVPSPHKELRLSTVSSKNPLLTYKIVASPFFSSSLSVSPNLDATSGSLPSSLPEYYQTK